MAVEAGTLAGNYSYGKICADYFEAVEACTLAGNYGNDLTNSKEFLRLQGKMFISGY